MFQSLIGILMNCNMVRVAGGADKPSVSIPNRDFDELQYELPDAIGIKITFQSLIGILMNCNEALAEIKAFESFQSLIGILMNCNRLYARFAYHYEFQSLIGILMNCNLLRYGLKFPFSLFQSLIGILMNCNRSAYPCMH